MNFIKLEISTLHLALLLTAKLFIGIGIGILLATWWLPYSYPLILLGVLILLPTLIHLFQAEEREEMQLKKRLKR